MWLGLLRDWCAGVSVLSSRALQKALQPTPLEVTGFCSDDHSVCLSFLFLRQDSSQIGLEPAMYLQLLILPLSSQTTHYAWPFSCRPIYVGNRPFQGWLSEHLHFQSSVGVFCEIHAWQAVPMQASKAYHFL